VLRVGVKAAIVMVVVVVGMIGNSCVVSLV
jgi:hypothetical protein